MFDYEIEKPLSVGQISRIRARLEKRFGELGFGRARPDAWQWGSVQLDGQLDLTPISGLQVCQPHITSNFTEPGFPAKTYTSLLKAAEQKWARNGCLRISCNFKEKDNLKSIIGESVTAEIRGGSRNFEYGVAGLKDETARRVRIEEVVKLANLPLTVTDIPEGFTLTHNQSKGLRFIVASRGANPSHFGCEIPDASAQDQVKRMRDLVEKYGDADSLKFRWAALYLPAENPDLTDTRRFLEKLAAKGFPVGSGDISFLYQLESIDGLDSLSRIFDQMVTRLCGFNTSEDDGATILALTSRKGHRLKVKTTSEDAAKAIEDALKLKLKPV